MENKDSETENLKKKVETIEERVERIEEMIFSEDKKSKNLSERVDSFASEIDCEVKQLKSVVDFEKKRPYILSHILGDSQKEKQQNFTVAFLTILKYCYNRDKVKASQLREIVEDRSLWNTKFGNNIKSFRPYIRQEGKSRSAKSQYKITHPTGTRKGIEILKKMIERSKNI